MPKKGSRYYAWKKLYGKKSAKSAVSQRRRMKKMNKTSNLPIHIQSNTQLINRQKRETVYIAKKAYMLPNISTAGANTGLLQWNITQFPDIGNYTNVFNQYKCLSLKYTFRLITNEFTDNTTIPFIYIRYNNDPNLTTVTEGGLLNQKNVVKHIFTGSDLQVSYTVKPRKMMASQVFNSTTLVPTPRKASWEDIDYTVGHYGLQYIVPSLTSGQVIELQLEATVAFREQW